MIEKLGGRKFVMACVVFLALTILVALDKVSVDLYAQLITGNGGIFALANGLKGYTKK